MPISMKDMDLLTDEKLRDLLGDRDGPCLSIYIPTHRKGTETQQDPIRLKNLAREAERQLADLGLRPNRVRDLVAPLQNLIRDGIYWQHQSDGLALFRTFETFDAFRLPLEFDELLVIGGHFHVKPLLPMIAGDGRFHVLALSQHGIRLLQGTRQTFGEADLAGVPHSLHEVLRSDLLEKSVQFHTGTSAMVSGGERAAVFHGHGAAGDEANIKKEIARFFRKLDEGVCDFLGGQGAPLVLAGVEFIRAIYREASHYRNLVRDGIDGNPDRLSAEELHRQGWERVAPLFQRGRREAVDRFLHLIGTGDPRAAHTVEAVVPAAYSKRVATLFVPVGRRVWGRYDPEKNRVRIDAGKKPGDEDLLNLALVFSLRNGGTVYAVPPEEMPGGAPVAAVFFS